jgi:hypothetical protein
VARLPRLRGTGNSLHPAPFFFDVLYFTLLIAPIDLASEYCALAILLASLISLASMVGCTGQALGSHTVTLYFFVSDMLFLLSWCFFVTFRKPPGFREKAYRVLDLYQLKIKLHESSVASHKGTEERREMPGWM